MKVKIEAAHGTWSAKVKEGESAAAVAGRLAAKYAQGQAYCAYLYGRCLYCRAEGQGGVMGAAGIVERVYYAVPTTYGIGREFPGTPEGHAAACDFARSTIRRIDYSMLNNVPDEFTRAFVDRRFKVRWTAGSGEDLTVDRREIKLTAVQRDALTAKGAT